MTGDKLTVTISGVDNQGKAITRTVEIPVKERAGVLRSHAHAGRSDRQQQAARHLCGAGQCRDGAHHHHDGERQDRGCCV